MQDAEKRVVDRAEQALRQNGHFLTFQQEQEEGMADEKPNGKKKGKGKSKDSKGKDKDGGC